MNFSHHISLSLLSLIFFITGCSNNNSNNNLASSSSIIDENNPPTAYSGWYRPLITTTWQWQLLGTVNTNYDVDLYDIDLFDSSINTITDLKSSGKRVICYFSAGSYENWRDDAIFFKDADLGNRMKGWDERWVDIRSENIRSIMRNRLDIALQKGCDGVEPDNMDGYDPANNSGFDFNSSDQLDYNRFIANEAHKRNLSVGLKNDIDQLNALVEYFDFAINEQCHQYSECSGYSIFINKNKPVLQVEYPEEDSHLNNSAYVDEMCTKSRVLGLSTLVLPLALDDSSRTSCAY